MKTSISVTTYNWWWCWGFVLKERQVTRDEKTMKRKVSLVRVR